MFDNQFEKFPGGNFEKSGERNLGGGEGDFEEAMKNDVPKFAGEQFGVANEKNEYYGESVGTSEDGEEFNEAVSNASNIINYGLNAASRELGVEQVVQKINDFDPSGSSNPIGDLYLQLGVDTAEERNNIREEDVAAKPSESNFRNSVNAPAPTEKSNAGALKAIADMKELVADVEGADPRYEELRNNAKSAGMGYFEYAVKDYGVRGLAELFTVLSEQKKKAEKEAEENNDEKKEGNSDGTNDVVKNDVKANGEAEAIDTEGSGLESDLVENVEKGENDEKMENGQDDVKKEDIWGERGDDGANSGAKDNIVTLNQDILKKNGKKSFDGGHSDDVDEELMRRAA